MTTKSRQYSTLKFRGNTWGVYQGSSVIVQPSAANRDYYGFERLVSNGHAWPPRKGVKTDVGGAFSVQRIEQQVSPGYARGIYGNPSSGNAYYKFEGQLVPNMAYNTAYTGANLTALENPATVNAHGTQGWARFKPTASRGGLDQAIGEIHQLPSLSKVLELKDAFKRTRSQHGWGRKLSKAAGGNYLNYVFGWAPLISDLIDLVDNSYKLEARMRQLLKDNDKPVRRHGTVSKTSSTTATTVRQPLGGLTYPALASYLYAEPEVGFTDLTTSEKVTFAGRFRYHIIDPRPYQNGLFGIRPREAYQLQRILYGGEFTPETLYNITPWSWLADWVAPIGDIVNNLTNDAVDGLVADYAYTMTHRKIVEKREVSGKLSQGAPYHCSSVYTNEVKERGGASPYGFGLTFSSFSPKRLAILAALGFTKLQ